MDRQDGWIRLRCQVLVVLLAVVGQSAADDRAEGFYTLTGIAPPGFENLAVPQRALVDVYHGDRLIATSMATYTFGEVAFDDPDALVAGLPPAKDAAVLRLALTGRLPTHGDKLCGAFSDRDCGRLSPTVAEVIFDADRFRADLFVNPDLLVTQSPIAERFLPLPDNGFSTLHNFAVAAAGSSREQNFLTVGAFTTAAYNENRLVVNASYSDASDLSVDRLFLQRDDRDREYLAGIFSSSGRTPSFSGENDIAGVRIASTLKTRTDLGIAYGIPMTVALASRARVDIIKDGRLVSSRFYEPGSQMLDTSVLPHGAYEITIRINEPGNVREEVRFFSKTSRVPPEDQPLFTFELGAVLDRFAASMLPRHEGDWIARAGTSRRLTGTFGVDLGAAATLDEALFETGIFQIDALPGVPGSYYELQATGFVGASSRGLNLHGQLRRGSLYAAMDFRHVRGRDAPSIAGEEFSLIPQSMTQTNLTLQMPLFGGVAAFTHSETRPSLADASDSQTLSYRRVMSRGRSGMAELRAEISDHDGRALALLGVRFYLRRGRWSGEVTPAYRYDDLEPLPTGHGYQLDALSSWSEGHIAGGDLRLSAGVSSNDTSDSLMFSTDFDNRLMRSGLAVSHTEAGGDPETSWAGNLATSLVTAEDTWALGAQNSSDAAVLVTLDGRSPDTDFQVLVDGYRRGFAAADTTSVLLLSSYRSYDIAIRPSRSAFVEFDDAAHSVTLYPGSVAHLLWQVSQRMVVVGQLTDSQGQPVGDAILEGIQGAAWTDEGGYFQAEIPVSDETLELRFRRGRRSCAVTAPIMEFRAGVAFVQRVFCDLTRDRSVEATEPGYIGETSKVSSLE